MKRIALAGKFRSKVRIALPVDERGPLNRSVTTGRKPTMWQCVREDVAGHLLQFGAAGKIPALGGWSAPGAVLGPVPRRHAELGVVAIADRAPPRGEGFLNNVWAVNLV